VQNIVIQHPGLGQCDADGPGAFIHPNADVTYGVAHFDDPGVGDVQMIGSEGDLKQPKKIPGVFNALLPRIGKAGGGKLTDLLQLFLYLYYRYLSGRMEQIHHHHDQSQHSKDQSAKAQHIDPAV